MTTYTQIHIDATLKNDVPAQIRMFVQVLVDIGANRLPAHASMFKDDNLLADAALFRENPERWADMLRKSGVPCVHGVEDPSAYYIEYDSKTRRLQAFNAIVNYPEVKDGEPPMHNLARLLTPYLTPESFIRYRSEDHDSPIWSLFPVDFPTVRSTADDGYRGMGWSDPTPEEQAKSQYESAFHGAFGRRVAKGTA